MSQKILITGCSNGFGYLTAKALSKRGHTVFASMRKSSRRNASKADELRAFAEDCSGTIRVLELDVTEELSVQAAVRKTLVEEEYIDVVVNNAGMGSGGWLESFTSDQFQKIFDVNLFGMQRVNRAVLPSMRERGEGLLIHVSSILGRVLLPYCGPYAASKFAVEAFAEAYNIELSGLGIQSLIVEPGGFATGFGTGMISPADEDCTKSYGELAENPEKMWSGIGKSLEGEGAPNPQDVADAIVALIEMPKAKRPLRTVVDKKSESAITSINQATGRVQELLLASVSLMSEEREDRALRKNLLDE